MCWNNYSLLYTQVCKQYDMIVDNWIITNVKVLIFRVVYI